MKLQFLSIMDMLEPTLIHNYEVLTTAHAVISGNNIPKSLIVYEICGNNITSTITLTTIPLRPTICIGS